MSHHTAKTCYCGNPVFKTRYLGYPACKECYDKDKYRFYEREMIRKIENRQEYFYKVLFSDDFKKYC